MMEQRKPSGILLLGVITTITVFIWISFEVYQILNKRSLEEIPAAVLAPLSPVLDTKALRELESKKYFENTSFTSSFNVGAILGTLPSESSPSAEAQ